jgi:hypothetical protein
MFTVRCAISNKGLDYAKWKKPTPEEFDSSSDAKVSFASVSSPSSKLQAPCLTIPNAAAHS